MSRTLTAADRSALIRLASTMPKGSPERKAILAGLGVGDSREVEQLAKKLLDAVDRTPESSKRLMGGLHNRFFAIIENGAADLSSYAEWSDPSAPVHPSWKARSVDEDRLRASIREDIEDRLDLLTKAVADARVAYEGLKEVFDAVDEVDKKFGR